MTKPQTRPSKNWRRHPYIDGARLKARRLQLNIGQRQLAHAAAVQQTKISRLELGKQTKPDFHHTIVRIAAVLKVSPEWLCGIGDDVAMTSTEAERTENARLAPVTEPARSFRRLPESVAQRKRTAAPAPEAIDDAPVEAPSEEPVDVPDLIVAEETGSPELERMSVALVAPRGPWSRIQTPVPARVQDALEAALNALAKLDSVVREEWPA